MRLVSDPQIFREEVFARDKKITHIIVDEIQRIPALLNEIHFILEQPNPPCFCLSGSSARKMKRSHANLLAGRAWKYDLFPLTHRELGRNFSLDKALNIGTLPSVYLEDSISESNKTLRSYVEIYLKEEIEAEALTRNIGGFLRFLDLAADENGNLINCSTIARESGISYKTVKEYFRILEDTLIGFFLFPYSKSLRKRLIRHPKFYFFDTGVVRALKKKLNVALKRKTFEYGRAFEHFVIAEIMRISNYLQMDYKFSFYRSSNGAEVDLIVETPKEEVFALEIKSSQKPEIESVGGLKSFKNICPKAKLYCVSNASRSRKSGDISILPWQEIFCEMGIG